MACALVNKRLFSVKGIIIIVYVEFLYNNTAHNFLQNYSNCMREREKKIYQWYFVVLLIIVLVASSPFAFLCFRFFLYALADSLERAISKCYF